MTLIQKKYPPPHEFWQRQLEWPSDRNSYVFLARAVDEVGKAIYGDNWRGFEVIAGLNTASFPKSEGCFVGMLDDDTTQRTLTLIGIRERFQHAKRVLADALADAKVFFALRHVDGGEFLPSKEVDPRSSHFGSELWNVDNVESRFDYCQVDLGERYSGSNRGDYFIFVDRVSLRNFNSILGSQTSTMNSAKTSEIYMSPYLRFMLDFVASTAATPTEQSSVLNSKKTAIEAALLTEWNKRFPTEKLGQTALGNMVTFLREFESKRGKNQPQH